MANDEELVELCKVNGDMEAQVIKSLLEFHGIACQFYSHIHHSQFPFNVDGLGIVKILINKKDYQQAKEILESSDFAEQDE